MAAMSDTEPVTKFPPGRLRWAWWLVAYLALGLGLVGIVVPGLPTVPFVLLSAASASITLLVARRAERRELREAGIDQPSTAGARASLKKVQPLDVPIRPVHTDPLPVADEPRGARHPDDRR